MTVDDFGMSYSTFNYLKRRSNDVLNMRKDLQIESALHGALERDELHLTFQPIVRSADGMLVGLETLLRWESPELGSISPSLFIPQLERNGLIIPVGSWVLNTACRDVANLRSKEMSSLRLTVNVSAQQLLHSNFVADVIFALEKSGLEPERLELEVTESLLVENAAAVGDVLRNLCLLGVRIAAEKLGTRYSSLSYLWKFPFSTLKIDRSFVAEMAEDPQVEVIVCSILNLARGLGLKVVAEGVETEAQFEMMKTLGCPLIQGYWTGRPLPIAVIKVLVTKPAAGISGNPAARRWLNGPEEHRIRFRRNDATDQWGSSRVIASSGESDLAREREVLAERTPDGFADGLGADRYYSPESTDSAGGF